MTAQAPAAEQAVTVVVPTLGRPSLGALLHSLAAARGPLPERVVLVDDRRRAGDALIPVPPAVLAERLLILCGRGEGPAAARNLGWRAAQTPWVAFLDDDVLVGSDWLDELATDLAGAAPEVAGSQARLRVPLPADRPPTDWERNTAGLAGARWATADMAYRRAALLAVGGFDERFPRAYREDADLGLRLYRRGWRIEQGARRAQHPVRPADPWVSVRQQAGNADDALMRRLHGRGWRARAEVPAGRRPRCRAITAVFGIGSAGAATGRRPLASTGLLVWAAGTAELTWARLAPGPRARRELATMLVTSPVLPVAATAAWLRGRVFALRARPWPEAPAAVLFDRDGTLVHDEPYNGDPDKVRPMPGARAALDRLRAARIPTAVVSNQSGIARGLLTRAQVDAVNRRVEALLGPLGPWLYCPHGADDECDCRKPHPGLIEQAAQRLHVDPRACAVVGDIGSDVMAARAVGARAVLVPTPVTRIDEIAAAPLVASDLDTAVRLLLAEQGATTEELGGRS
ncbi:MAG: HAD-IIIA family hydrolase [Egibacteraceae bacterium]